MGQPVPPRCSYITVVAVLYLVSPIVLPTGYAVKIDRQIIRIIAGPLAGFCASFGGSGRYPIGRPRFIVRLPVAMFSVDELFSVD